MTDRSPRQLKRTWAVLLALVAAGMLVARQSQDPSTPLFVVLVLLALAVLKARLVVNDFLGMRTGPALLRAGLIAWPVFFAFAATAKAFLAAISADG